MNRNRGKCQSQEDDCVMFIVINNDLGMTKGKIASQACHSACHVTRIFERSNRNDNNYKNWLNTGETKIVLKATQKEMEEMLLSYEVDRVVKRESNDVWCLSVHDFGRTQVEANSFTSIAFRPINSSQKPMILNKLKLL